MRELGDGVIDGSVYGAIEYLHVPGTLLSRSKVHMCRHTHIYTHMHAHTHSSKKGTIIPMS